MSSQVYIDRVYPQCIIKPESWQGSQEGSIHFMSQPDRRPQPIQNPDVGRAAITFSHPSEDEFAKMLDYYGIDVAL